MAERHLTGTKLRNRRIGLGIKQGELARQAGISASYLNLIEHNRRRIGGALLSKLAEALSVPAEQLLETSDGQRVQALRAAAAGLPDAGPEDAQAEEFVARFPGWSGLVAAQADRIARLEARVTALGDRLAHDPRLSNSLHDVITAVTAIRSTASILVESQDLDRDWTARFHRNIDADSRRLADSSQALAGLLDRDSGLAQQVRSPQEEADRFLAAHRYRFDALEAAPEAATIAELTAEIADVEARELVADWLEIYAADARKIPLQAFSVAAQEEDHAPERLAARFRVEPVVILRRLAALPGLTSGLMVCDQSGAILFQKPVMGVELPRTREGCARWPLFEALTQPGLPVRRSVRVMGAGGAVLECVAVASDLAAPGFDVPRRVVATMLAVPRDPGAGGAALPVGPGCRICPAEGCEARRQGSVLEGL